MSDIKNANRSFAIIGGDMRQIRLANSLAKNGYTVRVFGFNADNKHLHIKPSSSLDEAIEGASIIVLPLPSLSQSNIINTPLYDENIYICSLLEKMTKNQILLGGKIDDSLKTLLNIHNVYYIDYFLREELIVLNAALTAEGGISIALSNTPFALFSSKCLVIGYGRIGKILCNMLDGMGANVCACARKHEAFAWIDSYGYDKCHIDELKEVIGDYDIIFNTAPSLVITKDVLKNVRSDALIVDLASKPGGIDFESARELGINTIWALSLPGRSAPISAGDIIKQTILNICDELGV